MGKFRIDKERARLLRKALFLQAVCHDQEPRSFRVHIDAYMIYTGVETQQNGPRLLRLYETEIRYVAKRDFFAVHLPELDDDQSAYCRLYTDIDRLLANWVIVFLEVEIVDLETNRSAFFWGGD